MGDSNDGRRLASASGHAVHRADAAGRGVARHGGDQSSAGPRCGPGGHVPPDVRHVAELPGGTIAIGGDLTGAACWRADGTPIGVSGGRARPGIRFRPEAGRR
jgi:hypothetical protein